MPTNTSRTEDTIIERASENGTAELIAIIERLDDELTTASDRVKELEADLTKAEERIAELEAAE